MILGFIEQKKRGAEAPLVLNDTVLLFCKAKINQFLADWISPSEDSRWQCGQV